jgi:hypothetical protein
VRELRPAEWHGHTVEGRTVVSSNQADRGPVPGWTLVSTVAVVCLIRYASTHELRPGGRDLVAMVVFGLVATTIMDLFVWWRGE